MSFKRCVPLCTSNYKTSEIKVSVDRFPQDSNEKERWNKAIPRKNLVVNKNIVVCRLHWPDDFKTYLSWISRPSEPKSVFHNINKSCITIPPTPRKTANSSFESTRNVLQDQLQEFQKINSLRFNINKLSTNKDLAVYNVLTKTNHFKDFALVHPLVFLLLPPTK